MKQWFVCANDPTHRFIRYYPPGKQPTTAYCSRLCFAAARRSPYPKDAWRRRGAETRTRTQAGYGAPHQKAKAHYLDRLRDGDPCCLCGRPMYRAQAKTLHLDHTTDRRSYRGLAHAQCNLKAGASLGGQRAKAKRLRRNHGT